MGSGLLWLRGWDLGWKGKNSLNRVMRVFYRSLIRGAGGDGRSVSKGKIFLLIQASTLLWIGVPGIGVGCRD